MGLTLNGTEVSALGWWLVRSSGLDDLPVRGLSTGTLAGRESTIVTSSLRPMQPTEGVITLACTAVDASALATKRAALGAVLMAGTELTITSPRRSSQQRRGIVLGAPASYGPGPEASAPFYQEMGVRVLFLGPWEDSSAQSVNFTTSAVSMPMGSLDVRPVITTTASGGTVNNPIFTYKDGAGATVAVLAPTIAILNGDAWQVNVETNQVRKRVSGVWSNAIDTLPSDFLLPVFRAAHVIATVMPTLEVTGGNGNAAYRRAWL